MATVTIPEGMICLPEHLKLDGTLGSIYLGIVAASALFGVTCVQTYLYSRACEKDRWVLKGSIGILWVLDALHMAFLVHIGYFYAVNNFGNVAMLQEPVWSILVMAIATAVSDLMVRWIFSYRVYTLSGKNIWLTAFLVACAIPPFFGGIIFAGRGLKLGSFAQFTQLEDILYMSFAFSVGLDVIICVALCIFLSHRRTGFACVWALAVLIAFATMKHNYVFLALYFITPKLFLNSLLGTLNARQSLRENLHSGMVSIPLSEAMSTRSGVRQEFGSGENQASELVLDISSANNVKIAPATTITSVSRFRSRERPT
ncbi:hypothetical protein NLI96_g6860 [Meripilus lineatus]|uniref:DUF6534 domain-containing protein n=1 Tax=Meripilus lineatus TaxID=2056292 RepID=A0AAD5V1Z5_9APHY|nr:hypothetical protein NLI96_g6860 [Physisporinus lineatus]